MLSNYLSQILTMNILADSISIIDDKGIVRYFQAYQDAYVTFSSREVVGKHFLDAFPGTRKEDSTVLRALKGEVCYNYVAHYHTAQGTKSDTLECVYPIKLRDRIIGVACIARSLRKGGRAIELKPLELQDEEADIHRIIGESSQMQYLKMQIRELAKSDSNVLIYGETGSGKELVARALHYSSERGKKPFFSQNCAAIPEALLESIFFGTVKGAYTGAENRIGILEQANGGTLFLDEINSLAPQIQAKLLKALEEKRFRPLGGMKEMKTDFRVIAATNEDPFDCIKSGKLREDLFFRIGTVILEIPPLRERKEDIPDLVQHFIAENNEKRGTKITDITDDAMEALKAYQWMGNVRELRNVLESSMIFVKDGVVRRTNLPAYLLKALGFEAEGLKIMDCPHHDSPVISEGNRQADPSMQAPEENEKAVLLNKTLAEIEADVLKLHLETGSNHTQIAKKLGITRQTLNAKIKKYNLKSE